MSTRRQKTAVRKRLRRQRARARELGVGGDFLKWFDQKLAELAHEDLMTELFWGEGKRELLVGYAGARIVATSEPVRMQPVGLLEGSGRDDFYIAYSENSAELPEEPE